MIVILGILMAVAVPTYLRQQQKAHDSAVKQYLDIAYRSARAEATSSGHSPALPTVPSLVSGIGADQPQLKISQASSYVYAVFPDERAIVIDSNPSTGTLGQTFVAWAKTVPPGNNLWQVIGSDQSMTFILLGSTSAPPSNVAPPVITGSFEAGQTLTASKGSWSGLGNTCTYQWQTSGDNSTWSAIADETSSSYTLQSSDTNNYVRVAVTCTNANGSTTAYSSSGAGGAGGEKVSSVIPVATVVPYAGTNSLPSGWAVADGSCGYSSASYPDLWAAIGTAYGGTGSSNFCLPDLRGRIPLGKAASGTGSTLGEAAGSLDQSGTLTPWGTNQTLSFSWTDSPPTPAPIAHSHGVSNGNSTSCGCGSYRQNGWAGSGSLAPANESWTISGTPVSASGTVSPTASYTVSNPPFRVVRYLIAVSSSASAACGALWGYGSATLPSNSQGATGSPATGALSSCLDPAFAGNVPDMRGSFPVGLGQSGSVSTLNASGGEVDQTLSATLNTASTDASVNPGSWSLKITEASHSHGWAGSGAVFPACCGNGWRGANQTTPSISGNSNAGTAYASGAYAPGAITTSSDASNTPVKSAAFNQPFQTINWIAYTASNYVLAAGTITAFAGSTAPTGFVLADGSCYSTSAYASLYSVIGYTYGASSGSFCVPDLRGRFPLGLATSGTGSTLGGTGGSLSPTPALTFPGWTATMTVPAHSFSWSVPAHTHSLSFACDCYWPDAGSAQSVMRAGGTGSSAAGGGTITTSEGAQAVNGTTFPSATVTPSVAPAPHVVVNYVIKT